MFDTSSRTCVLPLAASKLYAKNHVGRLHTQHGSPFARLRTRVLDTRQKREVDQFCDAHRDNPATSTLLAAFKRETQLRPVHHPEATPLRAEHGQQGFHW